MHCDFFVCALVPSGILLSLSWSYEMTWGNDSLIAMPTVGWGERLGWSRMWFGGSTSSLHQCCCVEKNVKSTYVNTSCWLILHSDWSTAHHSNEDANAPQYCFDKITKMSLEFWPVDQCFSNLSLGDPTTPSSSTRDSTQLLIMCEA